MLTDQDIEKLKAVFMTKEEFSGALDRLDNRLKRLDNKLDNSVDSLIEYINTQTELLRSEIRGLDNN